MKTNLRRTTIATSLAVPALVLASVALARPPAPTPTIVARQPMLSSAPLYGQLESGAWVMTNRVQLFYVGERGIRSICPDGDYRMKGGGTVKVKMERIVPPWVAHGFAPQPEPPKATPLHGIAIDGRRLLISAGTLYHVRDGGPQVRCPDGVYALRGGGSVEVLRGQILNAEHLQGFAP